VTQWDSGLQRQWQWQRQCAQVQVKKGIEAAKSGLQQGMDDTPQQE
jgi:hypothetical protein